MTGYSRSLFGTAWTDDNSAAGGHNGCDTRNDILRRDLVHIRYRASSSRSHCVVASGVLHDPYTGRTIEFVRGVGTSQRVQIDHRVPLGLAWQSGARGWSEAKRVAFANDPRNLVAVYGPVNEAKGDADVASWLPPNKAYRCAYVAEIVLVKHSYGLWALPAEKQVAVSVLTRCVGE